MFSRAEQMDHSTFSLLSSNKKDFSTRPIIELDLFTNWCAFSFSAPRNTQEGEELIEEGSTSPAENTAAAVQSESDQGFQCNME